MTAPAEVNATLLALEQLARATAHTACEAALDAAEQALADLESSTGEYATEAVDALEDALTVAKRMYYGDDGLLSRGRASDAARLRHIADSLSRLVNG